MDESVENHIMETLHESIEHYASQQHRTVADRLAKNVQAAQQRFQEILSQKSKELNDQIEALSTIGNAGMQTLALQQDALQIDRIQLAEAVRASFYAEHVRLRQSHHQTLLNNKLNAITQAVQRMVEEYGIADNPFEAGLITIPTLTPFPPSPQYGDISSLNQPPIVDFCKSRPKKQVRFASVNTEFFSSATSASTTSVDNDNNNNNNIIMSAACDAADADAVEIALTNSTTNYDDARDTADATAAPAQQTNVAAGSIANNNDDVGKKKKQSAHAAAAVTTTAVKESVVVLPVASSSSSNNNISNSIDNADGSANFDGGMLFTSFLNDNDADDDDYSSSMLVFRNSFLGEPTNTTTTKTTNKAVSAGISSNSRGRIDAVGDVANDDGGSQDQLFGGNIF